MSRRDTILIAVIINTGLLAILFATAIIYDPIDKALEQTDVGGALVDNKASFGSDYSHGATLATTVDEVDHALSSYNQKNSYAMLDNSSDIFINEPTLPSTHSMLDVEEDTPPEELLSLPAHQQFAEVTVKKGDMLEKIARANGTTVSAIKKINRLQGERLQIGQVLKVPVKKDSAYPLVAAAPAPVKQPVERQRNAGSQEGTEAQYYVIKSGDNPWKLARQFNVKFEDILRLNHLDEERAKNLKIGDKIRVK